MLKWLKNLFGKSEMPFQGRYVLVVDDSPVEREFYIQSLLKAGFQCSGAIEASQALEMISRRRPDLIISDFMMPGMNGKEFCLQIKEDPSTKNIPVIFLTGSANSQEVLGLFQAGAENYLAKPIDATTLIRQVNMVFEDVESGDGATEDKDNTDV